MKDAYIVKKSVLRNPLRPKEIIDYKEYERLVEHSDNLIWSEDTNFGKRHYERYPKLPKKLSSYLNIDERDEKSFVQVNYSTAGYIKVQFDFKSTKDNLFDLMELANTIDCNLWQYKPKRQILTREIVSNRNKPKRQRSKPQTEIIIPKLWVYIKGDYELFLKVFKPNIEKTNASIAKINNNNSTNNKIVIIKISNTNFYITGIGIKYLYEKEIYPDKSVELKDKFEYQLNSLFTEVRHNFDEGKLRITEIEKELLKVLNEMAQNKSEIMIGKIQKKLF